jgi:hypothetical protein
MTSLGVVQFEEGMQLDAVFPLAGDVTGGRRIDALLNLVDMG